MGGYASAPAEPDHKLESLKKIGNNNKGDVVIIPVDQSSYSEAAFEWYVHHSHRPENVVRVVHAQEIVIHAHFLPELKDFIHRHTPHAPHSGGEVHKATVIEDQLRKSHQTGKNIIEKYEDKLHRYHVNGSVHAQFSSSPGELVMDSVSRFHATQVVMGCRGLGAIRRSILGSVSQYVINHSHVPVTVVPPEVKSRFF